MLKNSRFVCLQKLLPQHVLSRLVGRLAYCKQPKVKNWLIRKFITHYDIDLTEALTSDIAQYQHFNDFFIRRLKTSVRPIDSRADHVVSPADGMIAQQGEITENTLIQAKGKKFTLEAFLAEPPSFCDQFCHYSTVYLSPADYHRVHMPFCIN